VEAVVLDSKGNEVKQIDFPEVSDLNEVKGIRKQERGSISGHEDEYKGYFLMFKVADFRLDSGDYILLIRVTDDGGKIVAKEEEPFSVKGRGSASIAEEKLWGKVHEATDYVFYFAPTEDVVQNGKNFQVKGFVQLQEGYKATGLYVELIPADGGTPVSLYSKRGAPNLAKNYKDYPEASRYVNDYPVGGVFNVTASLKQFKNKKYEPGEYTLKAYITFKDLDGNESEEPEAMKRITITE